MSNSEHILISGGTGFIGQHLIPALLQQGHQVTVYGRERDKIQQMFGESVAAVSDLQQIKRPVNTIINLAGAVKKPSALPLLDSFYWLSDLLVLNLYWK